VQVDAVAEEVAPARQHQHLRRSGGTEVQRVDQAAGLALGQRAVVELGLQPADPGTRRAMTLPPYMSPM
jgi:hypothetical protein